jgi:hypothetical protein
METGCLVCGRPCKGNYCSRKHFFSDAHHKALPNGVTIISFSRPFYDYEEMATHRPYKKHNMPIKIASIETKKEN